MHFKSNSDHSHPLPLFFPHEPLRDAIPQNLIVILEYRIYRQCPCPITLDSKDILHFQWFLRATAHRIVGLLFEAIDGTHARYDSVRDVHDHGTDKQEGSYYNDRHHPNELHQNQIKGALVAATKEIVQTENDQCESAPDPCIAEE